MNDFFFLFIMVAIGFIAYKIKWFSKSFIEALGPLLLKICYPALIIKSMTAINIKDYGGKAFTVVIITLLTTTALFFGGKFAMRKIPRKKSVPLNFILGVGNVNYIGLPIIGLLFGPVGVFYAVTHSGIQDFFVWLLYYPTFINKKGKNVFKIIASPCIIALIIGIALSFFGDRFKLPEFAVMTISQIAGLTSPLAMLFLGATIASNPIFGFLRDRNSIFMPIVKVLLLPAVLFPFYYFTSGLPMAVIMCTLFACPAPIMSIIWSHETGHDYKLCSDTIVFSTFLFLAAIFPALYFLSKTISL